MEHAPHPADLSTIPPNEIESLQNKPKNKSQKSKDETNKDPFNFLPTDEEAALGMAMADASARKKILSSLEAKHFRVPEHAQIFTAIKKLSEQQKPCGVTEVYLFLKNPDAANTLCDLDCKRPITLNPDFFIENLLEREWKSDMLNETNRATSQLELGGQFDFDKFAEQYKRRPSASGLGTENPRLTEMALDDLEGRIIAKAQNVQNNIATKWPTLDKMTNGLKHGSLNVLAGRPGTGKTSLGLHFARQMLSQNLRTLYFTWEMTEKELLRKIISGETKLSSSKLDDGDLDEIERDRLMAGVRRFSNQPLTVFQGVPSIDAVCREIAAQCKRNHARVIFVDYIGLVKSERQHHTTRERFMEITGKLKQTALDFEVVIFALAQIRRMQSDRRPTLDDLKESGSIEEDADNVFLIYPNQDENGDFRNDLILAKARHGSTGSVRFFAEFGTNTFGEWSE